MMKFTCLVAAIVLCGGVAFGQGYSDAFQLNAAGVRINPMTSTGGTISVTNTPSVTITGPLSSAGNLEVEIQDQTTKPFDFFFTQIIGTPTTVATNTAIDDITVAVASTNGMSVGDYFGLFNADTATDNRAYFGEVMAITGSVVWLDTPIDFAFQVGDTAAAFSRNLNVLGTPTSQQIYSIQVGPNATQSIDIIRIMVSFITDGTVDLSTFGDIEGGLTYGVVLRRTDGIVHNIWNAKTNGDIAHLCFDYTPYSATNPNQGQDGAKFRYSFNGPDKHGVPIRLDPGDELQLIIQDDLTSLTQFRIIAEGHYVSK